MNIIIRTGFQRIVYNIEFHPATMSKGQKLVEACHVIHIEERREHGNCFIEAQVIRQASITSPPYKVRLNINSSRVVTTVSCTCVYKNSYKCKLVAALIFYINNEDSLSKTDFEQQWGKPTNHQLTREKYAKGKYFYEMFPCPPKKPKVESFAVESSELKDTSALKIMQNERAKDKNKYAVEAVVSSLLDGVENLLRREDCEACLENLLIFADERDLYSSNHDLENPLLQKYFNDKISMTKQDIIQMCCNTIDQSKCRDWFSARLCRISASSNCHKIKSRKKKSIESLVSDMLSPKTMNASSLRYGIENESRAKHYYKQLFNCEIIEVGVIVSVQQPWLCASLDGIVVEDGCITKLIEIKCPSSCSNQPIVDFEKRQCNVKYVEFFNEEVVLKKSALYYSQVQAQMYVTGLSVCDLFIYCPVKNGSCCVKVYRDEQFLKNLILLCEQFYFEHFLPRLSVSSLDTINSAKTNDIPKRLFTGKDISNKNSPN